MEALQSLLSLKFAEDWRTIIGGVLIVAHLLLAQVGFVEPAIGGVPVLALIASWFGVMGIRGK